MSAIHQNSVLRHLLRAPVYLYRWRLGPLFGKRFLLLTHTGRRTGLRHQVVLEVMEYREKGPEAVLMSGFGRNSDWLRNIETTPNEEVVIGSRRRVAHPGRVPCSFEVYIYGATSSALHGSGRVR